MLDLSLPRVMGILNLTPDSFYDGGRYSSEDAALEKARQMLAGGADIIDVGGVSSRPGSSFAGADEERRRVIPVIRRLVKSFPGIILSVDTFRSEIAREAVGEGVAMINDISAGRLDDRLWDTVAELDVPYVLMHMQGTPENMQDNPVYEDIIKEMTDFFLERILALREKGVQDIILDPGFGFGKTLQHNYEILRKLDYFNGLNLPMLAGVSRKSMICRLLGVRPEEALNGTTALHILALLKGVRLLRVHDVKEAVQAIRIMNYYHAVI